MSVSAKVQANSKVAPGPQPTALRSACLSNQDKFWERQPYTQRRGTMESRAKLAGHPIHQMLIVFPLGLLSMAVVFDVIAAFSSGQFAAGLNVASYYMIAAGIVMGLLAAAFGLVDYLAIPRATRAKRIGALHGVGNVIVVALFIASWLLRGDVAPFEVPSSALLLGILGALLATVTGWLGGELVDRLGVGIEREAGLNTPASYATHIDLTKRDAVRDPRI